MLTSVYGRLVSLLNAIANWRWFWWATFVGCAVPAGLLAAKVVAGLWMPSWGALVEETIGGLGVDPVKTLLHETGEDALGLLLATLAITPIRRIFRVNGIQKVRKLVGLWSFAFALLHVSIYLGFDQLCYSLETCDFNGILNDMAKRRFIFVGMVSFVILVVLAITSTRGWVTRLKKRWQTLHRLVYVAGIAGVIHFIWVQKADYEEPLMWAGWVAAFLLIRVYFAWRRHTVTGAGAPGA